MGSACSPVTIEGRRKGQLGVLLREPWCTPSSRPLQVLGNRAHLAPRLEGLESRLGALRGTTETGTMKADAITSAQGAPTTRLPLVSRHVGLLGKPAYSKSACVGCRMRLVSLA